VLRKIADAAPATFIAAGAGSILFGFFRDAQTLERLNTVLPFPWSVFWLVMMFLGSIAIAVGIFLRSTDPLTEPGRPQVVGQGLELFGSFAVGSMFFVYSLVLLASIPFWSIFPSLCWFWALASSFYGPFAVIVRDIVRAHRKVNGNG
jgi:hypothetical protein